MKKFLLENARPDKPVACPRCNSLNTKFCYFNNYNVKQPRHFCRECQRYWTAGGSLRNVPVGAGRRKHKIPSSRSHSNTLESGEVDECMYIPSLKPYHSLPFKKLVAESPEEIGQEIQNINEIQHDDVMSMYGLERPRLPQTMQKFDKDVALDSELSLASTHYDYHAAEKLGFLQMIQKRARDTTMDATHCKAKYERKTYSLSFTSTHAAHDGALDYAHGDAYHTMTDGAHDVVYHDMNVSAIVGVHDDADGKVGQISNGYELQSSECLATQDLSVSCNMAEHEDSTCCSSVTAPLASSSSEAVSETNGSSPTTSSLPPVTESTGLDNPPAIWGPLMWPWLWPFFLHRGNVAPGMPHVDPAVPLGFGAVASAVVPDVEAGSASNASHADPTYAPVVAQSFLQLPYIWNPLAWGSAWNVAWNGASIAGMGNQRLRDAGKGAQGSICVPKTLRMDHPDEAAYSSILNTLGVAALPHSPAGFLNAFQRKADVFQPKMMAPQAPVDHAEIHDCSSPPHVNPLCS